MHKFDVVIVGKGNAALCAALSAREKGASVALLEVAPEAEAGGNSRFTGGAVRFAYNGLEDLRRVLDIPDEEANNVIWDTNTTDEYFDDLFRMTGYRTDPDLSELLVRGSFETILWMRGKGVRFTPNYGMASTVVEGGKRKFFGRMAVAISGGGQGLVDQLDEAVRKAGATIFYDTRAVSLIQDGARVVGVVAQQDGKRVEFHGKSVLLAAGGFESNAEWRTRYLGPGWELAKVRGTRFNMGEGLRMALEIGAAPHGNWSGRHTTPWERNAPDFGDVNILGSWYRHSYPLSIMINAEGKRFFDEGADFYAYTYAKLGEAILKQPGQFAWQVYDGRVKKQMRAEYNDKRCTKVTANTIEELGAKMEGVDAAGFVKTVREFNAAVKQDRPFTFGVKDGRHTEGIDPPKSNWANPLDTPPFEAYNTTCGVTFTFGGLRVDAKTGQVLDLGFKPIPGLYCAGEMVGGFFYFNYPAGTGLVSGAVMGRVAGRAAAEAAA